MSKARGHRFVEDHKVYGFGTTCCWPGCYAPLTERKFPLCTAHTKVAHDYQRRNGDVDYVVRCSIEVPENTPPKIEPKATTDGTVYYVQVGGHIKIGWTSNLERRMKDYAPNSQLLAVHSGTRADEAKMHKRFATARTHGREWYAPVPSLLHHIEQMNAQHGVPEVTFGAAPVTILEPRRAQYVAMRSRSGASFSRT